MMKTIAMKRPTAAEARKNRDGLLRRRREVTEELAAARRDLAVLDEQLVRHEGGALVVGAEAPPAPDAKRIEALRESVSELERDTRRLDAALHEQDGVLMRLDAEDDERETARQRKEFARLLAASKKAARELLDATSEIYELEGRRIGAQYQDRLTADVVSLLREFVAGKM